MCCCAIQPPYHRLPCSVFAFLSSFPSSYCLSCPCCVFIKMYLLVLQLLPFLPLSFSFICFDFFSCLNHPIPLSSSLWDNQATVLESFTQLRHNCVGFAPHCDFRLLEARVKCCSEFETTFPLH